ncbi:Rho GTPase activation protein [Gilbertella persicaria]|nr:Rho GTPase activation protein [Gilbertella persicaria]KAI8065351.1 Rho GTPase activation protein [Gilbertella persicaria]
MSQYLIAVWDYDAEGEFELSFKQGDRIKLLEKHNDDWWEGELRESIGFFPANRIRLETTEELASQSKTTQCENGTAEETKNIDQNLPSPSLRHHDSVQSETDAIISHEAIKSPLHPVASAPAILTESPLPQGWEHAYDEDGTIYYFNEMTGESRWDRPIEEEEQNQPPPLPPRNNAADDNLDTLIEGIKPEELQKLEFDKLQKEWIRHKGYIQMKMISDNEAGNKLSSWKVYYAVLSNGFLLLYKEAHAKNKKSSKSRVPIGSFDLDSCKIDPAGKQDTKRKHVFIISTPKKVKLYVQTTSDKEFSSWLDAIMRELIARKEGQNEDSEILRLLRSLSIDESQMKVNRKIVQEDENKKKHWFSSKQGTTAYPQKSDSRYVYGQAQPSDENDVFGGYLHMEENGDIPRIVSLCVNEVEVRGLKSVGIYRLSGPASSIQKYRTMFNNKEPVLLKEEHDINAVTGLLKLYFRELRNPLMTYEYYEWFLDAARMTDYEERMYQIKSVIHSLPKPNYLVLEYLMRHLGRVASYSDINKMEASNLALIFSVGLLRAPQEDLSSIMMSDLQSKVIEAIIQQVDWFFEDDNEE